MIHCCHSTQRNFKPFIYLFTYLLIYLLPCALTYLLICLFTYLLRLTSSSISGEGTVEPLDYIKKTQVMISSSSILTRIFSIKRKFDRNLNILLTNRTQICLQINVPKYTGPMV